MHRGLVHSRMYGCYQWRCSMTLYQIDGNVFEVSYNAERCRGTLEQLTFLFDIDRDELSVAIVDMLARKTNVAHFGVAGTFLFSETRNYA
jgi:hypothetical protein